MDQQELCALIGARIRELRLAIGYSQDHLGDLAGVNRSYIGAVERAEHNIGVNNLEKIARALEVPVRALFDAPAEKIEKREIDSHESHPTSPAEVIVPKRTFFELLKQCAHDRPDLVVVYLERCGVKFIDP